MAQIQELCSLKSRQLEETTKEKIEVEANLEQTSQTLEQRTVELKQTQEQLQEKEFLVERHETTAKQIFKQGSQLQVCR